MKKISWYFYRGEVVKRQLIKGYKIIISITACPQTETKFLWHKETQIICGLAAELKKRIVTQKIVQSKQNFKWLGLLMLKWKKKIKKLSFCVCV